MMLARTEAGPVYSDLQTYECPMCGYVFTALVVMSLDGLHSSPVSLVKEVAAPPAEGRERAKGRGVRMGRKPILTPHQQEEVRRRKAEGMSVRELGRSYNVSPNTISRVR